jgi:predicted site-specific integrase-resolvase
VEYITTKQALKYLRFRNITTIWRWLKSGRIKGIKKNGKWLIEEIEI